MDNLKQAMKLSIIFGFIGAVLMPLIYEIYANISTSIGLSLALIWVIFAGIKFSALDFKEAFMGITCTIAYSGILGWVCYLFIHPRIVDMLISRSVYFQLTLKEQLYFVLYSFLIFLGMYLLWIVRFSLAKAIAKLKSNSEKTGEYINNAFNDENEDEL